MTTPPTYPEELLAQTAWLQRLTRELVPHGHSADLAQETLVAALERPKPTKASVRTWLERIARNLAAGATRARHRRLRREQNTSNTAAEPSTADTLAEFELHRSVVDAVQSLRDPIRTTLLLRFWEELPPREIAKRMDAPVETVRTRIKRGLQELRGSLDSRHGRREAWCLPLLSFATGRRAVATPASLAVSTSVILMNIKALAIGAIVVLGVAGAFAWNASQPDVSVPNEGEVAATPEGAAGRIDQREGSTRANPSQAKPTANERKAIVEQATADGEWLTGTVVDAQQNPIPDIEVSWLTESQANKFRRATGPKLTTQEAQLDRSRWTSWHLSDRGWMKDLVLLGKIFETEVVTRTGGDGAFRFAREATSERSVIAMWSPTLGCRFHDIDPSVSHHDIKCASWPRIRGHVTNNGGTLTDSVEITVDYSPPRGGRALQFEATESGYYETPQVPPGLHEVGFRTAGHHYHTERVDLRVDATIDATLIRFAQLRARLIDSDGRRWNRQRFAALGWDPDAMRFLLLRDDAKTDTDLSAAPGPHSELQFTPDDEWLQGAVADEQALVLSVWQGLEHIAATHLRDHRVEEVAIDLPRPKPATTLDVQITLDKIPTTAPVIHVALGTAWGMGRYNFREAAAAEGYERRFQLDVPRHLRGQTTQLRVLADGFAEQAIAVRIPLDGAPETANVQLRSAELTLRGKVIDENNQPLAGARVKLATAEGHVLRSRRTSTGVTGETGAFHFGNLTNRNVRVFVSRQGFATTSAESWTNRTGELIVRLLPGVHRDLDVRQANGDLVMLRVLDSQGTPLLDDRLYGSVHGGEFLRMRLSIHAHTVEVWKVGGDEPAFTIDLQ